MRQWRKALGSEKLISFQGADELNDYLEENPALEGIDCLVIDYYLGDDATGVELAASLKKKGISRPMFLCSSMGETPSEAEGLFDASVPKDAKRAIKQLKEKLR